MLSMKVSLDHTVAVQEAPEPVPAPHQAVVEVVASTVNRGELSLIKTRPAGWGPGQDVAGVVVAAAADGSGPPVGTRVIGLAEQGAWSERVVVAASRLASVPEDVDLVTAATLPMAGLTALRTLAKLGPVLGKDILVTGASGGVGGFHLQLARIAGARVTGFVRHAQDHPGIRTVTSLNGVGPFDGALDGVGGEVLQAVIHALRPGAELVWFGSTSAEPTPLSIYDFVGHEGVSIHTYFSYAADVTRDTADLDVLLRLVHAGELTIEPAARWPLTEAAAALAHLSAGGVRGKVVLTLGAA